MITQRAHAPGQRRRTTALLEGLFAVLVWGGSFIATKVALREASPVTVVWLRFAIGVAILAATVVARGQLRWPSLSELAQYAVLGLVGITFHQWLQSNALLTSLASTSGWIIASTPIFIALLGRTVLREKLPRQAILGIALATAGVLLVVSHGDPATLLAGSLARPGDLLMIVSALNWAVFSVLSRRQLSSNPAARVMLYVMGIGWLGTSALLVAGPGFAEVTRLTVGGWGAIAFLGVACSGLAYIAWYDALEHAPASQVGALLYLEPLIAMLAATVMLGERVVATTLLGGAITLLGVWLVNRRSPAAAGPAPVPDAPAPTQGLPQP